MTTCYIYNMPTVTANTPPYTHTYMHTYIMHAYMHTHKNRMNHGRGERKFIMSKTPGHLLLHMADIHIYKISTIWSPKQDFNNEISWHTNMDVQNIWDPWWGQAMTDVLENQPFPGTRPLIVCTMSSRQLQTYAYRSNAKWLTYLYL